MFEFIYTMHGHNNITNDIRFKIHYKEVNKEGMYFYVRHQVSKHQQNITDVSLLSTSMC